VPSSPSKSDTLKANGSFNPHPESVHEPLFQSHEFFDPRDLLQVKYEMLRRVQTEGWSVSQAATAFGLSRPSFYKARQALEQAGLAGLIGRRRGPRHAHKLSEEVMDFVAKLRRVQPRITLAEVVASIAQRFAIDVHVRSLQRALRRQEKKRRQPRP
jgi:transposase